MARSAAAALLGIACSSLLAPSAAYPDAMIAQVSTRLLAAAALLAYPTDGHMMLQYPESRSFDHSRWAGRNGNYFDDIDTVPFSYAAGGIRRIVDRAKSDTPKEDKADLEKYGGADLFPLLYTPFASNGNYLEPNSIAHRHSICGGPRLGASENFKPYSTNSNKFEVLNTFVSGEVIEMDAVVVIYHAGHIEMSICDTSDASLNPDGVPTQECFNKYPLSRAPGDDDASPIDDNYKGRYYVQPPCRAGETNQEFNDEHMPEIYGNDPYRILMRYELPKGLTCEHCVLQMHYFTGHVCQHIGYEEFNPKWPGQCAKSKDDWIKPDTLSPYVCGEHHSAYPEEFWNCSDIAIVSDGSEPAAPPAEDKASPAADEEKVTPPAEEKEKEEEEYLPEEDEEEVSEEDEEEGYSFVYLGCVADSKADRIMERMELPDDLEEKMTGELCMDICQGYKFSGTQWAKECWCGGEGTDHLMHCDEDDPDCSEAECDMPCTGDASETCGGFDTMEVRQFV